ncbi:zeta toxin family protein [Variovorax saccharolyticus]|uniref:zeta toxin family protein n=1 Tax=Variovorax saccharolyticus TaxID=3053516 RepID=UPI002576E932|nr:zeta toxin family protein [Variovorax sp. J31P216]MDM0029140.1 zeta toxin family protein [Variovorax sp. J31P216]
MSVLHAEQFLLSEADHQAIFESEICPALLLTANSVDRPVAVVFGGQPGAGKSAAVDAAIIELSARGGAVEIIGDDLRAFHPRFKALLAADDQTAAFYTDRDSALWVEKAIAYASDRRYSVIIEGTYRNSDVVAKTMQRFRSSGYEVDARALAVNERFSRQGIIERYESQRADRGSGRMTTPEAHRAAYEGMPLTVERIERERLADRLTIYRRGAEVVYANQLQDGQWKSSPLGRQALERERSRAWTSGERRAFFQAAGRIDGLLLAPGRNASFDTLQKALQLNQSADPIDSLGIHSDAMAQLDRNFKAMASDTRFDAHSDAELAKGAYFRGAHDIERRMDGLDTDFEAYDTAMADRGKVQLLPEIPDLQGRQFVRETRSRGEDIGISL